MADEWERHEGEATEAWLARLQAAPADGLTEDQRHLRADWVRKAQAELMQQNRDRFGNPFLMAPRRGSDTTSITFAVLIGLCLLGIVIAKVVLRGGLAERIFLGLAFAFLFVALDFFVSVVGMLSLWRRLSKLRISGRGARLLWMIGLVLGFVPAVVIFFFVACGVLVNW